MKKKGNVKGLGTVLHVVDHKLIVKGRAAKVDRIINSIVMTREKRRIGKVYDVFGPINRPYISIKLFKGIKEEELQNLVTEKIFTL